MKYFLRCGLLLISIVLAGTVLGADTTSDTPTVTPSLVQTTGGTGASISFVFDRSCRPNPNYVAEISPRPVDEDISNAKNTWWDQHRNWRLQFWIALGCSIILSTLVATSFLKDTTTLYFPFVKKTIFLPLKSVASFGAALSAAFLGTINPQMRSERYLHGYVYIRSALVHYQADPSMTPCELAQAYARSESIVHSGSSNVATDSLR